MYVLMTMDSEEAYAEIFKYLRQLAPEFTPQAIITGFDLSMQRAAQQVFGSEHSQLLGCFFHFSQVRIFS